MQKRNAIDTYELISARVNNKIIRFESDHIVQPLVRHGFCIVNIYFFIVNIIGH